jgi:hypothetical protein
LVISVVLVLVALGVWSVVPRFETPSKAVRFSDFMGDVAQGRVERVSISGRRVTGIYRADQERFHTYAPDQYADLADDLNAQGIAVSR